MEVRVTSLPEALAELVALLEAQAPNAATAQQDALATAITYQADLEQLFVENEGEMPGARLEQNRLRRWWQYTDRLWVVYEVTDRRRRFRSTIRTVTIVGFEAALPGA